MIKLGPMGGNYRDKNLHSSSQPEEELSRGSLFRSGINGLIHCEGLSLEVLGDKG